MKLSHTLAESRVERYRPARVCLELINDRLPLGLGSHHERVAERAIATCGSPDVHVVSITLAMNHAARGGAPWV